MLNFFHNKTQNSTLYKQLVMHNTYSSVHIYQISRIHVDRVLKSCLHDAFFTPTLALYFMHNLMYFTAPVCIAGIGNRWHIWSDVIHKPTAVKYPNLLFQMNVCIWVAFWGITIILIRLLWQILDAWEPLWKIVVKLILTNVCQKTKKRVLSLYKKAMHTISLHILLFGAEE